MPRQRRWVLALAAAALLALPACPDDNEEPQITNQTGIGTGATGGTGTDGTTAVTGPTAATGTS